MNQAILIVDHGSTRPEANAMLEHVAALVQYQAGDGVIVRYAHMELAEPSMARGFADCIEAGATEVVVFPYMLSPGKHSTRDIPRLIAEAAAAYPGVQYRVTPAFGVHEKLGELILMRAGVPLVHCLQGDSADRCWDPAQSGAEGTPACGDACRLRGASPLAAIGH
jgi:sirohydrochlorin ferrochelatase